MHTSSEIRIRPVSGNFEIRPAPQQLLSQSHCYFNRVFFSSPLFSIGTEITGLAHQLGYEREVIRIWFCNKRQALKNTVRMMSKGMV